MQKNAECLPSTGVMNTPVNCAAFFLHDSTDTIRLPWVQSQRFDLRCAANFLRPRHYQSTSFRPLLHASLIVLVNRSVFIFDGLLALLVPGDLGFKSKETCHGVPQGDMLGL